MENHPRMVEFPSKTLHVVRGFPIARCLTMVNSVLLDRSKCFFPSRNHGFSHKRWGGSSNSSLSSPLNYDNYGDFSDFVSFLIDSNQPMKLGKVVQAPCYCYPSGAMLCVDPQAEAMGLPSQRVDDDLSTGWLKDFFAVFRLSTH